MFYSVTSNMFSSVTSKQYLLWPKAVASACRIEAGTTNRDYFNRSIDRTLATALPAKMGHSKVAELPTLMISLI
jgi:hypothetical protein